MKILIVNGVNLKQLGSREINVYGSVSFDEYVSVLHKHYPSVIFDVFQSDQEGEIASMIASAKDYDGVILNAGAYTHTSVVLADAVRTTPCDVVEVHISNLFGRERFRRESMLAGCCVGLICGFGLESYRLAVEAIVEKKNSNP